MRAGVALAMIALSVPATVMALPPTVIGQLTGNPAQQAVTSDQSTASDEEAQEPELELDQLIGALRDPDRLESERSLAAARLLELGRPEALAVLIEAITGEDAAHRRLVTRGLLLASSAPPPKLTAALLDRLYMEEGSSLDDMAHALARDPDYDVTRDLANVATDSQATEAQRRAAVVALGCRRSPESAAALISIATSPQTDAMRGVSFDALRRLTGLHDWPDSPELWSLWWSEKKAVTREQFVLEIANTLANERVRLDSNRHELVDRITRLFNRLYRIAPETHPEASNGESNNVLTRTELLVSMFSDTLPELRLEAMSLAEKRLVDNLPMTEPVREALRHRVGDPSPAMRERAALMLRDLNDEPGAERIARRLQLGDETDTKVQEAFFRVMARLPRAAAVKPALDALLVPNLRNQAAGALAAAAEAQLLGDGQKQLAVRRVRQHLEEGILPDPDTIKLLGRIGDDLDWLSITRWLDVDDDRVKQAAAQAWRQSSRSLQPLAERASDPIIGYIASVAIRERGKRPETMVALAKHPPPQEQALAVWRSALVEMARRVPAQAVLDSDAALEERGGNAELRTQMLSAAIDQALQDRDAKLQAEAEAQDAQPADAAQPASGPAPTQAGTAAAPTDRPSTSAQADATANESANNQTPADTKSPDAAPTNVATNNGTASNGTAATDEKPAAPATATRELPPDTIVDPGEAVEVITSAPSEADRLLVELILAQGKARMHDGDLRTALTDVQRVRDLRLPLTPTQRDTRNRLVVRASLAVGDIDRARRTAAALLRSEGLVQGAPVAENRTLAPEVVAWFIELAERHVAAGQKDQVPVILSALNTLTNGRMPAELAGRVTKVRQALAPPAPTPTSAPSPAAAASANGASKGPASGPTNGAPAPAADNEKGPAGRTNGSTPSQGNESRPMTPSASGTAPAQAPNGGSQPGSTR